MGVEEAWSNGAPVLSSREERAADEPRRRMALDSQSSRASTSTCERSRDSRKLTNCTHSATQEDARTKQYIVHSHSKNMVEQQFADTSIEMLTIHR